MPRSGSKTPSGAAAGSAPSDPAAPPSPPSPASKRGARIQSRAAVLAAMRRVEACLDTVREGLNAGLAKRTAAKYPDRAGGSQLGEMTLGGAQPYLATTYVLVA